MASTSTLEVASSFSSSSFPSTRQTYDVFLNFYGKDTRNNFIDHLHAALKRKGISSFKDDEKLEQGNVISEELMQAIENSQYAIVVISKRYAFSKWCLIELAKIMECMSKTRLKVLPIFYLVNPSDVRKQNNNFKQAFFKHEQDLEVSKEQINTWRVALNDAGNLVGWHINNSPESMVIEDISQKILEELRHSSTNMFKEHVGISSRVKEIISLLHMGLETVRFVGICGMGGIGKTTLAKVVYDEVSPQFEASCFVAHIREKTGNQGLIDIQTQIISEILKENRTKIWNAYDGADVMAKRVRNKNAFIVLDDVDSEDQLKALVRSHNWFGQGSKIILTSRDRHLLKLYVDDIYDVKELNYYDSLMLFSLKAFRKFHPEQKFIELSKDIVWYIQGVPLALEVLGSFLFDRTIDIWEEIQNQLKANPKAEIFNKLKISFDGLEDQQQKLFLDIACLFTGKCQLENVNVLQSLGHYSKTNMEVLWDKCLIKKSLDSGFHMHDLLRDMGQQIVRHESLEPGKRSRLSSFEDIVHISKYNTGTNAIEGIALPLPSELQIPEHESLNFEIFSRMNRLKLLAIGKFRRYDNFCLNWHGNPSNFTLSNELCFLQWPGYPLQSLPHNFQANNLVELIMPYSHVKKHLGAINSFHMLKGIDLSYSYDLVEVPNLSGIPNLEELKLRHCHRLSKVHSSVGFLRQLKKVNMEGCEHLNRLPNKISLESLEYLNLAGCLSLKKFPDIMGNMASLKFLDLVGTAIKGLPLSFKTLSSLEYLNFGGCFRYRKALVHAYSNSFFAGWFVVSPSAKMPPDTYPLWQKMEGLDVRGISSSPSRSFVSNLFSSLTSLKELDLSYLNMSDATMPHDFGSLSSIKILNLSGNKLTTIPNSIYQLSNLIELHMRDCRCLQPLSKPLLSCLSFLKRLNLGYCNLSDDMVPNDLGFLYSLEVLSLCGNKFKKIPYLVEISTLSELYLDDCTELQVLPLLPLNLNILGLSNFPSLEIPFHEMDSWTSNGILPYRNSFVAIHFGSNGRPYKIPYWDPSHPIESFRYRFDVTVGPALPSGIPNWFNERITSSFGTIECPNISSENRLHGYALLILYEVHKYENFGKGTLNGSTRTLPHFVCQFQVNKVAMEESLILCAPEVLYVGLNGFWVFVANEWFTKMVIRIQDCKSKGLKAHLEALIKSCSPNVEVKECGARFVYNENHFKLYEVINNISLHTLNFKDFECSSFQLYFVVRGRGNAYHFGPSSPSTLFGIFGPFHHSSPSDHSSHFSLFGSSGSFALLDPSNLSHRFGPCGPFGPFGAFGPLGPSNPFDPSGHSGPFDPLGHFSPSSPSSLFNNFNKGFTSNV